MKSGHAFLALRFGSLLTIKPVNFPGLITPDTYIDIFPDVRAFSTFSTVRTTDGSQRYVAER